MEFILCTSLHYTWGGSESPSDCWPVNLAFQCNEVSAHPMEIKYTKTTQIIADFNRFIHLVGNKLTIFLVCFLPEFPDTGTVATYRSIGQISHTTQGVQIKSIIPENNNIPISTKRRGRKHTHTHMTHVIIIDFFSIVINVMLRIISTEASLSIWRMQKFMLCVKQEKKQKRKNKQTMYANILSGTCGNHSRIAYHTRC